MPRNRSERDPNREPLLDYARSILRWMSEGSPSFVDVRWKAPLKYWVRLNFTQRQFCLAGNPNGLRETSLKKIVDKYGPLHAAKPK